MAASKKKPTAKKTTATADSRAKKAQLKRGAAAKKKGAEGPKKSSQTHDWYRMDSQGDVYKKVPVGKPAPKGAKEKISPKGAARPGPWNSGYPQSAYGVKKKK